MQRLESVKGYVLFIVHVLNLKKPKTESTIFQDCKASSSYWSIGGWKPFHQKGRKTKAKQVFQYLESPQKEFTTPLPQNALIILHVVSAQYRNADRQFINQKHCRKLRMPKLQENFTIVAIVCHRYKRLAVLQNVHAIILLGAKEDV